MNVLRKPLLAAVNKTELAEFATRHHQPKFRSRQLYEWIFNNRTLQPSQMKNIPLQLRTALEEDFCCISSEIEKINCAGDETEKVLLKLRDGNYIEMVIISSPERMTFCLSTQVGCPVQCYFCASGVNGLTRNLEAGELIEQLYHGCERINGLPDNIVFMGIGEGLLNFTNLSRAIKIMCDPEGLNISPRRITVSTSGYIPGITKLAKLRMPLNLAVSLHAPNDEVRQKLIPDELRFSVADIIDACNLYRQNTGRMVTFEYTLISGINDTPQLSAELAELARKNRIKVNLIPYNPVPGSKFQRPSDRILKEFESILIKRGIKVTMRMEKGSSVNAACGQLRAGQITK